MALAWVQRFLQDERLWHHQGCPMMSLDSRYDPPILLGEAAQALASAQRQAVLARCIQQGGQVRGLVVADMA